MADKKKTKKTKKKDVILQSYQIIINGKKTIVEAESMEDALKKLA